MVITFHFSFFLFFPLLLSLPSSLYILFHSFNIRFIQTERVSHQCRLCKVYLLTEQTLIFQKTHGDYISFFFLCLFLLVFFSLSLSLSLFLPPSLSLHPSLSLLNILNTRFIQMSRLGIGTSVGCVWSMFRRSGLRPFIRLMVITFHFSFFVCLFLLVF